LPLPKKSGGKFSEKSPKLFESGCDKQLLLV
jgi:hypothetical protein